MSWPKSPTRATPKGFVIPYRLFSLTGAKSYTAIAQFGRDKGAALALALGFRRGKTLAKSTLSTLFRSLDVQAFEDALTRWVASRLPHNPDESLHICIDGKTLRGSKDGAVPGVHLVDAYAPPAQSVLAHKFAECLHFLKAIYKEEKVTRLASPLPPLPDSF